MGKQREKEQKRDQNDPPKINEKQPKPTQNRQKKEMPFFLLSFCSYLVQIDEDMCQINHRLTILIHLMEHVITEQL